MRRVTFPTFSPFVLRDALRSSVRRRVVEGGGLLYEPAGPSVPGRRPAVVLMEGLGGLKPVREIAYGEQLARWGYVTLVVDSYGPRGAAGYGDDHRALVVTESMMLADAYAGLRFLTRHPLVDPERVAVMGFSYGGMVSVLAAWRQIRDLFAEGEERFGAHASYYGCSVPRLDRVETTGAPVLMLLGELDENVSLRRSRDIADDLRRGGSSATVRVYPEIYHQWDGGDTEMRHVRFNLANLRLRVDGHGRIRDERTGLIMRGRLSRVTILAMGVGRLGYDILADPKAKQRSDADLRAFFAVSIGTPEAAPALRMASPPARRAGEA